MIFKLTDIKSYENNQVVMLVLADEGNWIGNMHNIKFFFFSF